MQFEANFEQSFLTCLNRTFEDRKQRNANFSLRSYARLLKVSPGQLSQLLSKKRKLTEDVALRIWEHSSLSHEEKREFALVFSHRFLQSTNTVDGQFTEVNESEFEIISRWYFYPILNLCTVLNGKISSSIISRELEIPQKEARAALRTLEVQGFLIRTGTRYKRRTARLTTTHGQPNAAIRRSHKEVLERAAISLGRDAIEKNDLTNITMAIDPKKLPKAKKMITEFRRKLCHYLESGETKAVYTMAIQLFPVSKKQGEK